MELKFPPPLLFLCCAILIFCSPNYTEPHSIQQILAILFALFALSIDFSALLTFFRQKTTITPLDPHKTNALVVPEPIFNIF